jgi:hypothetical protein
VVGDRASEWNGLLRSHLIEGVRLGADADRYSFTVVDLHHLLLAGLCRRTISLESRNTAELAFGTRKPVVRLSLVVVLRRVKQQAGSHEPATLRLCAPARPVEFPLRRGIDNRAILPHQIDYGKITSTLPF